jgi:hypothetical protein
VDWDANRRTEQRQLLCRCRPSRICGHEQWTTTLAEKSKGELCRGRRLACALEAKEQDACGSLPKVKRSPRATKGLGQGRMDDADQTVSAADATHDAFVVRTLSHGRNERIDDGERNVGIDQRRTNLSETRLEVCLTDATSPTESPK